jgi:hypothetical protein
MEISLHNYIRSKGAGPTFEVDIDPLPSLFSNYYEESLKAAEYVWANKQGTLFLLYSGGLDSEYALSVFLALRMNVVPVIIHLTPNYNDHDIEYAFRFCKQKNIKPLVIDVNFDEFVESGLMLDLSMQIRSWVPVRAATAHVCGMLDGTVLLGDGEPTIEKLGRDWYITILEHDYALVNYFKQRGLHGTPHFNRYTPEMMASFLTDPVIMRTALNVFDNTTSSDRLKCLIYNADSGFNLEARPKYHGYETVAKSEIVKHGDFLKLKQFESTCKQTIRKRYFDFITQHGL